MGEDDVHSATRHGVDSTPAEQAQEAVTPVTLNAELVEPTAQPGTMQVTESDAVKTAQIYADRDVTKHKWTLMTIFGVIALWFGKDWWSKRDLEISHKDKEGITHSLSLKTPHQQDKPD